MAEPLTPETIRGYLLGRLTGAEREAVATRIFEDDDTFAQAREMEDDLIDALARGDLSGVEADEVRSFVDESGQSQRLVTARALARSGRRTIRGPVFVRVFVGIAATLLITLTGAFFYYQAERQARQQSAVTEPAKAPMVFAFAVPPGATRGSSANVTRVKIPAGTDQVRIRVELEPGYQSYSATLQTTSGKELLKSGTGELVVSASLLPPGRYEIAVTGTKPGAAAEALNFHYFEIE